MLMDEPFSAVDPVVREQLQDEFLRLQGELGKTILFVTHDIDEAIKLGDQVAVMRVGGTLAQLAAPAYLLAHPVDDFVADFVGRDRGYRALSFQPTPRLPLRPERTLTLGETTRGLDQDWVLVVDDANRPLGWVEPRRIDGELHTDMLHRGGTVARASGPLRAALDAALSSPSRRGVIVDDSGALAGTVRAHEVLTAIEEAQRPEAEDPVHPGRRRHDLVPRPHRRRAAAGRAAHLPGGLPLVFGLLIALPLGWVARRWRPLYLPFTAGFGLLYTIPSLALFILMPAILHRQILDPVNVVVAMTIYTVALLVRTVADGLGAVPDDVTQAATAMGYGAANASSPSSCPWPSPSSPRACGWPPSAT